MDWSWTYLIPLGYLVLMVVIGVVAAKKNETRSDFYVASNRMNGSILFATIFATVFGANGYLGTSGQVYNDGFNIIWINICAGSAYFLLFFISGKIRGVAAKHEVFTLPDIMELRFSKQAAYLTTTFSLIAVVGGAGGAILGVGTILNSILGIDTTVAILITAVVTIVYTTFGGLMGVAVTDWVQSMIMIFGMVLIIVFGFVLLSDSSDNVNFLSSGMETLTNDLGPDFLSLTNGVTFLIIIAWAVTFAPLNTISQNQIQRVYAAKTQKTIQRVSLLMVLTISLFMAFGLALIGVIGKQILPGLENAESVYPMLAMEVTNPVIGMIIVTGILGACMSTIDSNLLGSGIHISRDIYERHKRSKGESITEKKSLRVTRTSLVIIGVFSTVAALMATSILDLLLSTLGIFAGGTFIPVLAGIYWKRMNAFGAITGQAFGGGATIIATVLETSVSAVLIGIIFSLIGTVGGSLLTSAPEKFKAELFDFSTVTKKDIPWLLVVVVLFVAFIASLTNLALWPLLIAITVIALTASMIMLLIYILPRKNKEKAE
ncbi:sodium:solute symporter [Salinicoccus hispanicus]|uniref:Sodium:solute symporter family protein n=1 Tax=Salinicoccus hispanicus TaxID=157225 RepID=A0A6N8TYB9_9STAP|nr:sodium:solute symporter family protein [Salinicoccus hispanicus]MXQ50978.1 sodium:solute symporter family protein [Salinicoccus hispanicus]